MNPTRPGSGSLTGTNSGEPDPRPSKSFECPVCGKQFARRENRIRHQKTHNPIKPHRCSICQKEFTRSDLRQRHEATHANSVNRQRPQSVRNNATSREVDSTVRVGSDHGSAAGSSTSNVQQNYGNSFAVNQPPSLPDRTLPHVSPMTQTSPASHPSITSSQESHHSVPYLHASVHHDIQFDPHSAQNFNPVSNFMWHDAPADPTVREAWFDAGFYSALMETGTRWSYDEQNPFPGFAPNTHPMAIPPAWPSESSSLNSQEMAPRPSTANRRASEVERFARMSSPPNEASEEDKWPYTWNPHSRDILTAKAIDIPDDHPLFMDHNRNLDISPEFYARVISYIDRLRSFGLGARSVTMPSLRIANLFIGLFFRHFEPQMPVLHRPTLETLEDLPEPLIAIMIVIGATYCAERHTRRFSIVLLDIVRLNLVLSLEIDNRLMRDSMIIYAATLICHAGLWCGNKRAFELAEIFRGAVVTYLRRNHFTGPGPTDTSDEQPSDTQDIVLMWRAWIAKERRKRLCWVIYMLDYEFPCLLNLPSTLFSTELATVECPCDEEFWQASTARRWKRLLGPASVPPSKNFISAIGPFMGPMSLNVISATTGYSDQMLSVDESNFSRPISLNSWSRFLVLLMIHTHIFEFSQRLSVVRETMSQDADSDSEDDDHNVEDDTDDEQTSPLPGQELFELIQGRCGRSARHLSSKSMEKNKIIQAFAIRMNDLLGALSLWNQTYMNSPPSDVGLYAVSKHFHETAATLLELGTVYIYCSITDLQNGLGKSGQKEIPRAMSNLSQWANLQSVGAIRAAAKAVEIIDRIANHRTTIHPPPQQSPLPMSTTTAPSPSLSHHSATLQPPTRTATHYETIAFFISNVLLWAFASVADESHKQQLLRVIRDDSILDPNSPSGFLIVMEKAFSTSPHSSSSAGSVGDPRTIFRSAAEVLPRLGNWGAALNLALLLHQRSQM